MMNDYARITRGEYPYSPGWKGRDTSHDAAQGMKPKAGSLRERVMDRLRLGPASPEMIAADLGVPVMNVRPRCSELSTTGRIVDTGERGPATGGRQAIIWRVADTFADEQERVHCRLDYHRALEEPLLSRSAMLTLRGAALIAWVLKYGDKIANDLLDFDGVVADAEARIEENDKDANEAEAECARLEKEVARLELAITQASERLDEDPPNVEAAIKILDEVEMP